MLSCAPLAFMEEILLNSFPALVAMASGHSRDTEMVEGSSGTVEELLLRQERRSKEDIEHLLAEDNELSMKSVKESLPSVEQEPTTH